VLILSRFIDERIIIGDDIVITVVDIREDKVRLGIAAPRGVTVHRLEVARRIRSEGRDPADRASLVKGGGS
jgi:carbon storage regulator